MNQTHGDKYIQFLQVKYSKQKVKNQKKKLKWRTNKESKFILMQTVKNNNTLNGSLFFPYMKELSTNASNSQTV